MSQSSPAPFLRDPVTVPRKELIEHYRVQAARYQQLAERQRRSSVYEGLVGLARQCTAMADALASPKKPDRQAGNFRDRDTPSAKSCHRREQICLDRGG